MSEKPRDIEQQEHLREKLVQKLNELASPLVMWNTESKSGQQDFEDMFSGMLSNEELIRQMKEEGTGRKALVELMSRLNARQITPEEVLQGEDWDPDMSRCMFLARMAIGKLNKAIEEEREISDIETVLEAYVRKGIITQSDIYFGKLACDRLKEITADAETKGRVDWQPSIPPPPAEDAEEEEEEVEEENVYNRPTTEVVVNGNGGASQVEIRPYVTITPPGAGNENVNETGPTQAVPVFPAPGGTGFASSPPASPGAVSGFEPTVEIPALKNAEALPPSGGTMPSGPARSRRFITRTGELHTSYEDIEENPEIATGPVAILAGEKGQSIIVHLFSKRNVEQDGYVYTIGTDPRCDIRIENGEYHLIKPFHGRIKITHDGQLYAQSGDAAMSPQETGLIFPKEEWTLVREPEKGLSLLPQITSPNQGGGKRILFTVMPQYQYHISEDKDEMRKSLRKHAQRLIHARRTALTRLIEGTDNGEAAEIDLILAELMEYDNVNEIGCFTTEMRAELRDTFRYYRNQIENIQKSTHEEIEVLMKLQLQRRSREELKQKEAEQREEKIRERAKKEGVANLHLLPEESPEDLPHVFRCPVYYLKPYGGDLRQEPRPMLIPRIALGEHDVCHEKLVNNDLAKGYDHRVAPFMGKLFYKEEGDKIEFYLRYLQPNTYVRKKGGQKGAPARATFRVDPTMQVELGPYSLWVDNQLHGFSYGKIKKHLETMLDKLLLRIKDQKVTTWEQDEEAQRFLRALLTQIHESSLPQELKKEILQDCRQKYEKIAVDLWNELCAWGEENITEDSGLFQTLMLFARASREEGLFKDDYFLVSREHLHGEALRRVQRYAMAAEIAGKKPSIGTRFFGTRIGRKNKQETEQLEREKKIAELGMAEVARFIEFQFVTMEDFRNAGAPPERCEEVLRILKIRKHFARLRENDLTQMEEILELKGLCKRRGQDGAGVAVERDLSMCDVFAPEEITTRNLHIEIDMKPEDSLLAYVRKVAVFAARKAFKRIISSTDREGITRDARLIRGLKSANLIHLAQMNDELSENNEYTTPEAVEEALAKKEREAANAELALLQRDFAREREEKEVTGLIGHADAIHETLVKARKHRDLETLRDMIAVAPFALDERLQKLMARRDYDLYIQAKEHVRTDSRKKVGATETRKNWRQIFAEWRGIFMKLASEKAKLAVTGRRVNAHEIKAVLDSGVAKGVFTYEDLGVTSRELERGVKAGRFLYDAMMDLENFDYLQAKAENEEDTDFWGGLTHEITRMKMSEMLKKWRKGGPEAIGFKMAMKVLQRKDPRAVQWFENSRNGVQPTAQERDLLQLGK